MWTNVFKIGGLHQVSWFQFLPQDSDCNPLPDKSGKLEQKDAAMLQVISAHLRLQQEGFLSTWTNSFVGPWDPSQGLHNPDDKIKLWLFLPERHLSVVETAQPAVSRLKVVASGLWLAPGDSEEIAAALSQALRNCIERALSRLSYTRYGDVFTKSRPSQNEELLWRGQPAMEFIFAATDEAIFVHVIISSKHIRALLKGDMEKLSNRSSNQSSYRIPVIVAPHGMHGSLTGCCPSDLVKHVYCRSRTSDEDTMQNYISQGHGGGLGGQNCYVEVKIGCHRSESDKTLQSNPNAIRNLPSYHMAESSGLGNHSSTYEKMFIYPAEAVIVPLLQTSFAKSSLKRVWLQNWIGPYLPSSSFFTHCSGHADSAEGSWNENSRVKTEHGYNSSSNSNCSSLSSVSSSSSDSAYKMTTGSGDLEADADSLTCRNSGLSSRDQLEIDSSKLGSKRPRASIAESFGQAGTDFGSADVNTSGITGVGNEHIGTHWDLDDDDRGMGMDIQALLSEFGDFGDFFENDSLPFGEPPGTAESQATMFSPPDCVNGDGSPVLMDVSDQIILPVGFPSFDSFNPSLVVTEECLSKNQEVATSAVTVGPTNFLPPLSTGEFDHVIKAEALMTFAPEYGAVETITSETSSSVFKNPYFPKTLKTNSSNSSPNNYVYGATSPSTCVGMLDEKSGMVINPKNGPGRHDKDAIHQSGKYYDQVASVKEQSFIRNGTTGTSNGRVASALSTFNSLNAMTSIEGKISDNTLGTEHILLSMKSVLATEVECILFQASMCKIRHMILSSSIPAPANLSRQVLNHLPSDRSTMTDNLSSRYDVKKKESIPVRIAGDFDGGVLDGHMNAPVGVWRSVGGPKASKPTNSANTEATPSLPHHTYSKEGILSFGQKQQLTELLDGMSLLVQQATSFVDVALDSDCGDGSYGWLALEEQSRRGLSCGPSMVHAGCGGTIASCHSLDIAGVELIDPLSADIHASSVISLLQSEIKTGLKTAFGNVDGPLPVLDWCKGRGQACDTSMIGDGSLAESAIGEGRDSSSSIPLSVGEQMSPTQSSAAGSSGLKSCGMIDGSKLDETCQRRSSQEIESDQQTCSRPRPTLFVLASPAILVGYQDDWLKTSACSLQLWEKAPLEPYAMQKNITYNVICPDIDPLTTAAADFFQQLGTVYETCKLGTHSPHSLGSQMEIDPGKLSSSGFVLLDSPRAMKMESSNASLVESISDYFLSLSNGWDLASYLKSLTKAIKALKINPCLSTNPKEGISCPCTVIYVVCPFPEPVAVLQTVVESCAAAGSVCYATEREKRSALQNQVGKALSVAAVDEALVSNVLVLSGFGIPKLVVQIITVDVVFRVTTPALSELIVLKEIAFTVYNKARRIPRGSSNDLIQSSSFSNRSHSVLTQLTSIPGMWKDCVGGTRMTGTPLPREGEMDVSSMRSANWDNSWQSTARTVGLNSDSNRNGELFIHDTVSYMFEPLFILSEPGSLENAISPSVFGNLTSESSKLTTDDAADTGMAPPVDVSEFDGHQKNFPSLHCCYGWTEDWRWLVCVWTDARGELLDTHIFPFGGISSRQDTKGLQCLFVQVLTQGCQILQACALSDTGAVKPRDFVIARIGSFYELEYLEWQKAIFSVGGSEVKKWPLQLRRFVPDGMPAGNNGTSLQQQDMSLIQDRTVLSSPNPMYSTHSKTTGFIKSGLGQANMRNSRGILQWVQSISFATISLDHTLNIVLQADSPYSGGIQGSSSSSSSGPSAYVEGFTAVKSLGCTTSTSYLLIPSPSMRFLPTTPLQLPTCLTADSPPLAHLLHSKGFAIPLSTGFAISKAVPSLRKDTKSSNLKDEWPCVLSVSLIDYYGGNNNNILRGPTKQGGVRTTTTTTATTKDFETETHLIVENIVAELHALSWMTISPAYIERRSALPFHCDMVLRLRRLIHFAGKELSQPERS